MRKNLAMYAIYAAIAIGIGTWVACNGDIATSTVPEPAAIADELEVPARVVGPERMNAFSSGGPVTPEVRHGDGHGYGSKERLRAASCNCVKATPFPPWRCADPIRWESSTYGSPSRIRNWKAVLPTEKRITRPNTSLSKRSSSSQRVI